MPGVPNLSLVEGSFEELALELATYLDGLKGEGSTVAADITPSLADAEKPSQQTDKDAVLKKLVIASAALNGAPERELQAAYNLLIHLISQVEEPERYLPPVCKNLSSPITSSPQNGTGIALGVLSTLFNAIQPDEDTRYHVLLPIIELVKTSGRSGTYDTLAPQLTNLDAWLEEWEMEPDECRKLYLAVSQAAGAANRTEDSYIYLLKALRTLQDKAASPEARELSLRALKTALQAEKHFDFQDLTALDSIQALRKSDEAWGELLEIFSGQLYEDLQEFKEANTSFLSSNGLNEDTLDRKMRLLTLT
ncbi:PCI-domain-containing protein, partial [Hortaea werneckii]